MRTWWNKMPTPELMGFWYDHPKLWRAARVMFYVTMYALAGVFLFGFIEFYRAFPAFRQVCWYFTIPFLLIYPAIIVGGIGYQILLKLRARVRF
jgi:hypothetical protein